MTVVLPTPDIPVISIRIIQQRFYQYPAQRQR